MQAVDSKLKFRVADMALAEWGKKEMQLSENEMPGLMALRKKYGKKKPLKGLKIRAGEAVHSIPALGYRIESKTKTVVYSGDTEPTESIRRLAGGADLLIHECSFPEPFVVTNHSTPKRLGETFRGAGVKRIVLTHLYPQTIGCEDEMVRDVRAGLGPGVEVEIGRDLQKIAI